MIDNKLTPVLTITGSDGTGTSGIQADIKVFEALGIPSVSVITSITVQNTLGIQEFFDLPSNIIEAQIEALVNDTQAKILKLGMIRNVNVLKVICDMISKYNIQSVIYNPIVYSSNGDELMSRDVISQIKNRLLPLSTVVVIRNIDAEYILGITIESNEDKQKAIAQLKAFGCKEVVLVDSFFHGKNNYFSSAVASYLSKNNSLEDAINNAYIFAAEKEKEKRIVSERINLLYQEFIDAVSKYYKDNRDVRFYSDLFNVSSRYLSQVTKAVSNKTPKTIIEDYLIEQIELDLQNSFSTIQEIAYRNGFSSQAHFTKFFKKKVGVPPSNFRKKK